ncbi:hypothetical protein [Nocardia sp. NPDC058633]|uniref:hypothetical protein n=1 Tax=Nocardia sp. NPDC058633 TaxID=3346568 RepID=UPI0036655FF0
MADHSALIAEAREYAEVAWEKPRELLLSLVAALESSQRAHEGALEMLDRAHAPLDQPIGYTAGWVAPGGTLPVLDTSEVHADLGEVLAEVAEAMTLDSRVHWKAYALTEMRGDLTATASPDRPQIERVATDFETVLRVYMDGFGTGAASALAKIKPGAPGHVVDEAAQALVEAVGVDPIAVEQLRDMVRNRLRGDVTNETTEVSVWTPEEGM